MPVAVDPSPPPGGGSACSPALHAALALLLQAHTYADNLGRSPWDFAVAVEDLERLGLTKNDVRWLACLRYVKHASETTRPGARVRTFRPTGELVFTPRTCVLLTEAGVALARTSGPGPAHAPGGNAALTVGGPGRTSPHFDGARRILHLGGHVIKHFKQPAPSQEMILAAFEEEGWPAHLDDPLPPEADVEPKQRLHSTISNLNRHQKERLIRFLGDGTGRGVCWELLAPSYCRGAPELH